MKFICIDNKTLKRTFAELPRSAKVWNLWMNISSFYSTPIPFPGLAQTISSIQQLVQMFVLCNWTAPQCIGEFKQSESFWKGWQSNFNLYSERPSSIHNCSLMHSLIEWENLFPGVVDFQGSLRSKLKWVFLWNEVENGAKILEKLWVSFN